MALRIIKRADQTSLQIKQHFFSGDRRRAGAEEKDADQWVNAVPSIESGIPPIDSDHLARVEKNAFENGFHQGQKAGLEEAEKKLNILMQRYAETITEIDNLKTALYSRVEREVVKLALEVAKKIVHREVQADPEIVQTLVKVTLSHAASKSAVKVRLHPSDYSNIMKHRLALSSANPEGREIELVSDKSIEQGGCLVQTECGDIDARIAEKFREVERSFFASQE
jgi:flagellar assembly protein FliH